MAFFYDGVSTIRGGSFYTFCAYKNGGIVAHVPMYVTTVQEARAAMVASTAAFLACADEWKKPLDDLRSRITAPPPEGYELTEETRVQVAGILWKTTGEGAKAIGK